MWEERDDYKPNIGDLVIYAWNDGTDYATTDNITGHDHVGIVCAVSGNDFDVIEGNYSKSVKIRRMKVNGRYIRGFCLPAYHLKATGSEEEEMTQEHFNQLFANAMLAYLKEMESMPPHEFTEKSRKWAENNRIVIGDEDGNKRYTSYTTLEQVAELMYRLNNTLCSAKPMSQGSTVPAYFL